MLRSWIVVMLAANALFLLKNQKDKYIKRRTYVLMLWLIALLLYLCYRFGRKPVLFGAIATLSIFSLALKFAQSWAVFAVLFYMVGMGQLTSYIVLFVLGKCVLLFSGYYFPLAACCTAAFLIKSH